MAQRVCREMPELCGWDQRLRVRPENSGGAEGPPIYQQDKDEGHETLLRSSVLPTSVVRADSGGC